MSVEKKGFRHLIEGTYPATHVVGKSVDKVDGYALASGAPMYTDDIAARDFPNRLHGKILTSRSRMALLPRSIPPLQRHCLVFASC